MTQPCTGLMGKQRVLGKVPTKNCKSHGSVVPHDKILLYSFLRKIKCPNINTRLKSKIRDYEEVQNNQRNRPRSENSNINIQNKRERGRKKKAFITLQYIIYIHIVCIYILPALPGRQLKESQNIAGFLEQHKVFIFQQFKFALNFR